MRKAVMLALLVLLLPVSAFCQVTPGTSSTTVKDEGITQGSVTTMNFVGAGVACVAAAGTGTCTITGGVGTTTVLSASLAMAGETKKRFTITDATISATSKIVLTVRRPNVTIENDTGTTYTVNVVTVALGSFDVVVRVDDPDADADPPTETIEVHYVVG